MNQTMREWVESVIQCQGPKAFPIMTHPGIEMIGKTVYEAVTNGVVQHDAITALQKKFRFLAAPMMMDLTVEAEAFGCPITFSKEEVPAVTSRIVSDFDSVQQLKVPSLDAGRIPPYLKAAELTTQSITHIPVFAGCIGPFSLAGRLFDMTEIMTAAYLDPETVHLLLSKCTAFLLSYIKAYKKTGVHGILMAEPAAGMLSEDMCQSLSSDFVRTIVDEVQDESFIVILHNCGNTGNVTSSMISTGAAGLHFGNKIDMLEVLDLVPSGTLVFGNLDPVNVFKLGTSVHVKKTTRELLDKTKLHSNFVISSGCDIPPGTPPENVTAFFEEVYG